MAQPHGRAMDAALLPPYEGLVVMRRHDAVMAPEHEISGRQAQAVVRGTRDGGLKSAVWWHIRSQVSGFEYVTIVL